MYVIYADTVLSGPYIRDYYYNGQVIAETSGDLGWRYNSKYVTYPNNPLPYSQYITFSLKKSNIYTHFQNIKIIVKKPAKKSNPTNWEFQGYNIYYNEGSSTQQFLEYIINYLYNFLLSKAHLPLPNPFALQPSSNAGYVVGYDSWREIVFYFYDNSNDLKGGKWVLQLISLPPNDGNYHHYYFVALEKVGVVGVYRQAIFLYIFFYIYIGSQSVSLDCDFYLKSNV